jgi:Tfp pilus assembly protein PilW
MNTYYGTTKRSILAFTLNEMIVSMALVCAVVAATITVHLMGLRLCQFTKAKLGASDEARQALSKLVGEIRGAKILRVGTGGLGSFSETALGLPQVGNSLQINLTTNTNAFVRYFWDSADKKLKRTTNGASAALVVATSISNEVVFAVEDAQGTVLTNNQNNRVVHLKLEFFQIPLPNVAVGPGGLFDYYQLSSRITRRALE